MVSVCVGDCVGKPDFVVCVLEGVLEREGIVVVSALSIAIGVVEALVGVATQVKLLVVVVTRDAVWNVFDICAVSFPAIYMLYSRAG